MNPDLKETLNLIQTKTEKLIELCEALREQNDLLNLDNQSLKVALETSQKKDKLWKEKFHSLEISKTLSPQFENNKDIKQKITKFVMEIEKCIDLINQ